jgi:hypothetical protein
MRLRTAWNVFGAVACSVVLALRLWNDLGLGDLIRRSPRGTTG